MSLTKNKFDEKIIAISHAKRKQGRKDVYKLNKEQEEFFKNRDSGEIKGDVRKMYVSGIKKDVALYKTL